VLDENLQSQRAPFQHGSTYIDQLLNDREIVVQGIISVGTKTSLSYPLRHDLVSVINPLLGQGVITYTNDHVIRKAMCTAIGPVFANNNSNEGSQKYMITFHCNDPFLYFDTASTISLPTPATSTESVVNAAQSFTPSVIQKADGDLFVVYRRLPDSFLVSRTFTTSWGAESVVNAALTWIPSVIQKADGDLFVVYLRGSDSFLVSRTFTTSWGAESVVNAEMTGTLSVIQKMNGDLFVVYLRGSNGFLMSRTFTTSWGAESVVNAALTWTPSVIQKMNGDLFVVYRRASDGFLMSRTFTTSWNTESVVNAESTWNPSVIQKADGSLFVVYSRPSDNFLVSRTRSVVVPVNASNTGQYLTPVVTRLNGPSINPRVVNFVSLLFMRLNIALLAGDYFIIDTSFGKKSVSLMKDGILQNGIQYMDSNSTFFDLAIGDNTIYYEDDAMTSAATATMTWTCRDVGV
jgi:hypothetical protein